MDKKIKLNQFSSHNFFEETIKPAIPAYQYIKELVPERIKPRPQVLFITSYPPRICSIANYSKDLINAITIMFDKSFDIKICALENGKFSYKYPVEVKYILNTTKLLEYRKLAGFINNNDLVKLIVVQHDFGFFPEHNKEFSQFLYELVKPIIIVFHTVIPNPNEQIKSEVKRMTAVAGSIVVMNDIAAEVLLNDYYVPLRKIKVIEYGIQLGAHLNKDGLKKKYGLDGCPIISTSIPHTEELITERTGKLTDFQNSQQLSENAISLLNKMPLNIQISPNSMQKIDSAAWENSAIAHVLLFETITKNKISPIYNIPFINLGFIKHLTTSFGISKFSKKNQPDIKPVYTLDDNAMALIAICMHYELTSEPYDLKLMKLYMDFINYCQQADGKFYNYIDKERKNIEQGDINMEDAGGKAVWAIGYIISRVDVLPKDIVSDAFYIMQKAFIMIENIHSPRAVAYILKGLYYYHSEFETTENITFIKLLANRLVEMYKHESNNEWKWFEGKLSYANSVIPESLLCAWLITNEYIYKDVARASFNFLISLIFNNGRIEVVSNKGWLINGQNDCRYGELPIDVAHTIVTLSIFYNTFKEDGYLKKLSDSFNWFTGNNQLHQIVYNPTTGGCYDGLGKIQISYNQGAESTVNYLIARLTIEKYKSILFHAYN